MFWCLYSRLKSIGLAALLTILLQGRTITRDNHGLIYPLSKFVTPVEDHLNEFDKTSDLQFASADQSFERNSFSSSVVHYSGNSSLYAHSKSRHGAWVKDSSFTALSQENMSKSNDVPQSKSMLANVVGELDTQASAAQRLRKPTLLAAGGDESNFMKAWTTSIDEPSGRGGKVSLSSWDRDQVDSSAGARNVEECDAGNSKNENVTGTKRKLLDQPEMSRNPSISSQKMINDPVLPSTSQCPSNHHLCGSHLNEVGIYEVVCQVHNACDLPSNSQGRAPQPYVTGKTTADEQGSGLSQSATHATIHPTYSPIWEELLVVKVSKENFQTHDLILSLVDHLSKTLITIFKIPLQSLKPFHPYHMELEQVESDTKSKLFITLMFKTDELSLPSLHSEIFGLEVAIRHFTDVLADNSATPLIAVLRVVPSFTQYRQAHLDTKPRQSCITTKKVRCPSSDLASNLLSIASEDQYNVPQITFSGEPSEQPSWDQTFFFHGDDRSLFSNFSTLVIEYFSASQVVSFGRWEPRFPIGFSYHSLDHSLLTVLQRDNASMGVRIDNIVVVDSPLQSKTGERAVSVNVILRLITEKRPDPMLSSSHYGVLPVIDMAYVTPSFPQDGINNNNSAKKSVVEALSINRTIPLPMINQNTVNHNPANTQRSDPLIEQSVVNSGLDASTLSILEHQTKEIEKHRYAMKKMADDIIQLRSEATRLQAANSRLRLEGDRRSDNDFFKSLHSQFENTTHAELVQRIIIIKGSLDEQTAINRELRLEMQSLQNQLIKKNEKEKEFYKLQDIHKNQQILLQKMQERLRRTKTLEETCKKQEKVIIRLEDFLANPDTKEKAKKSEVDHVKTISETLSDENKRLRAQVLSYERTSKVVDDMDRLQVHDKLQRAEGRVAALEKEVLENTRRWARDKAELQLKLSETQMSQESGHWQYPTVPQEPLGLFERTPPSSRNPYAQSRHGRPSPKLSPLNKK